MTDFAALNTEAQKLIDAATAPLLKQLADLKALIPSPTPTPTPNPVPATTWPNASNTGFVTGPALTAVSGDLVTISNGQVISGKNVNGTIVVKHTGVTVKNCIAKEVHVSADACTIQDCDIPARGVPGATGITLLANNCKVLRCDISKFENGIWIEGSGHTIQANYLHDAIPYNSTTDPHIDGFQMPPGCTDILFEGNNVDLAKSVSASLTMGDKGAGNGCKRITIRNNRFMGGSYIVYIEGADTIASFTGNRLGGYTYGYMAGDGMAGTTFSGNVDDTTGKAILGS